MIDALRDFDLVIPDAPGFGFSNPVADSGWTTARVAKVYDQLMRRLGYTEYGVHGSDNGALIAREFGLLNPYGFLGLHVLQLFSFPSGDPAEFERLEPQDYAGLEHMQWFQSVGGYNTMNALRPQTVSVGLSDSPVALLAYSELFISFGNGTSLVPLEKILTEVSLYWFANASAGMSRSDFDNARAEPSRRSTRPAPVSRCSPTTSRRSASSPSATTRISRTGAASRRAATSRRSRCPRSWLATSRILRTGLTGAEGVRPNCPRPFCRRATHADATA